jgi:hypothetical protein
MNIVQVGRRLAKRNKMCRLQKEHLRDLPKRMRNLCKPRCVHSTQLQLCMFRKSSVLLSKYARHVSGRFYSTDNSRSNDFVIASPIEGHVPSSNGASSPSECRIVVEKAAFKIKCTFDPFKTIHIRVQVP